MIWFAISLPVLLAMAGMAVELAMAFSLDSQLADIADHAALGAASKLDGSTYAITNATNAGNRLQNQATLSGTPTVSLTYAFYASDQDAIDDANELSAAQASSATAVRVTTDVRSFGLTLLTVIGATPIQTRRVAIAHSTYLACQITPLMICNPWEPQGQPFSATVGQQFKLNQAGAGSLAPGDFGLLDPPGQTTAGAGAISKNLAMSNPPFCFSKSVSLRTGTASGPVDNGINSRFDFYNIPNGQLSNYTIYPTAPDVIKGGSPQNGACNWNRLNGTYGPETTGKGLPRDTAFSTYGAGSADWYNNWGDYWSNHFTSSTTKPAGFGTSSWTRYDQYLWEQGVSDETQTATLQSGFNPPSSAIETPGPVCGPSQGQTSVGLPSRRVIWVALTDCIANGFNGTQPILTNASFGKFFITEPSNGGTIYLEFIKMAKESDPDNPFHHVVELIWTN